MYGTAVKIIGYHGTYPEWIDSIKENNFKESVNHDIWLGDGVYFFIDGISITPPSELAAQFAIDQCYNKETKAYDKEEVCVIKAAVRLNEDKSLDLTQDKGYQLFNMFRDKVISSIEFVGKKPVTPYRDVDVFKVMRQELGIEFVKSNLYIKFAVQRIGRFESNIPNVTVLVVNNPAKNIQKPSIQVILKKGVK